MYKLCLEDEWALLGEEGGGVGTDWPRGREKAAVWEARAFPRSWSPEGGERW